jgi:hypothetical protein
MFMDSEQDPDSFYNATQNNNEADWDKIYAEYDAAVDWPTCTFYKELMNKYPDAKVVLTVRSADSWYQSVKKTIHATAMNNDTFNGEKAENFKRMINHVVLDGAVSDPERFEKEEDIKQIFLDHNEEVKHYVPTDKLYVMEIGEGWEGLCKFLGKDVPDVPYPRGNSTDGFKNFVNIFSERFG